MENPPGDAPPRWGDLIPLTVRDALDPSNDLFRHEANVCAWLAPDGDLRASPWGEHHEVGAAVAYGGGNEMEAHARLLLAGYVRVGIDIDFVHDARGATRRSDEITEISVSFVKKPTEAQLAVLSQLHRRAPTVPFNWDRQRASDRQTTTWGTDYPSFQKRFPMKNPVEENPRRKAPTAAAVENAAVATFGLTEDPLEAGYILTDGRMLDFSGKNEGGSGGMRSYDHREVARAFIDMGKDLQGGTEGMLWFMKLTGAIRISMFTDTIQIDCEGVKPTAAQSRVVEDAWRQLGRTDKVFIDYGDDAFFQDDVFNERQIREALMHRRGAYEKGTEENPSLIKGEHDPGVRWTSQIKGGIQPKSLEKALRLIAWDTTAPTIARLDALSLLNGDVEGLSREHGHDVMSYVDVRLRNIAAAMRVTTPTPRSAVVVPMLQRWIAVSRNPRPAKIPAFDRTKVVGGAASPELALIVTKRGVRVPMGSPQDIAREFAYLTLNNFEEFWIAVLDNKHRSVGRYMNSRGSLSASAVYVTEVLRVVLYSGFTAFVCVHNHPSGDPNPSSDDLDITNRLVEAARLVGMRVLDHVIVARGGGAPQPGGVIYSPAKEIVVGSGSAFAALSFDTDAVKAQGGYAGAVKESDVPEVMTVRYKSLQEAGIIRY